MLQMGYFWGLLKSFLELMLFSPCKPPCNRVRFEKQGGTLAKHNNRYFAYEKGSQSAFFLKSLGEGLLEPNFAHFARKGAQFYLFLKYCLGMGRWPFLCS